MAEKSLSRQARGKKVFLPSGLGLKFWIADVSDNLVFVSEGYALPESFTLNGVLDISLDVAGPASDRDRSAFAEVGIDAVVNARGRARVRQLTIRTADATGVTASMQRSVPIREVLFVAVAHSLVEVQLVADGAKFHAVPPEEAAYSAVVRQAVGWVTESHYEVAEEPQEEEEVS